MQATARNTHGACERCGEHRPFVMASGFYPDASFRMLCGPCDRIERPRNQPGLFAGVRGPEPQFELELDKEPEPAYNEPSPQMNLF